MDHARKTLCDQSRMPNIETLIASYGNDILRLCYLYLGDYQLAEDAFQETFVKAWQRQASFRGESTVKTWLSHIAVNTCRDILRSGWFRLWRKGTSEEDANDISVSLKDYSDVREAVLTLPGKYREVVVLYYYEGLKLREVAKLLHLPTNTVSTRLRRARNMLNNQLKGE